MVNMCKKYTDKRTVKWQISGNVCDASIRFDARYGTRRALELTALVMRLLFVFGFRDFYKNGLLR